MNGDSKPIAVVQGAASPVVQDLLRAFVRSLPAHVRVAGVIEDPQDAAGEACGAGLLRRIGQGGVFSILQDLGSGSGACRLDAAGVVAACDAVLGDIEAGCDLVVLNKFAKIEAERSGLAPAFAAAMQAGLPILTSVSPKFAEPWDRFAAPLYAIVPADLGRIEAWWAGLAG